MEANYGLKEVKEESQYKWPSQNLNPKPNLHTFPEKNHTIFPFIYRINDDNNKKTIQPGQRLSRS